MNFFKLFPIIIMITGVFLLACAANKYQKTVSDLKLMGKTKAIVIDQKKTRVTSRKRIFYTRITPIFEFIVDEKKYKVLSDTGSKDREFHKIGDTVSILFNKKDPTKIRENYFITLWLPTIFYLIGGAAVFVLGFFLYRRIVESEKIICKDI